MARPERRPPPPAPPFRFTRTSASIGRILFRGEKGVLSEAALASLGGALRDARASGCRLVRFESALPGLFAAGADLNVLAAATPAAAARLGGLGQRTFERIARLPALTVAILDGSALGGGLDLALACDLRFATPRARLGHPGVRLGLVTSWGGTARLPDLIGRDAAWRILAHGHALDAAEAAAIGLVDRVGTRASLLARCRRLAEAADGASSHVR